MRGEVMDNTVRKGSSGEEVIQSPPKLADRTHAAELLSKRYGLFTERHEPEKRPEIADEIDNMAQQLLDGNDGA